MRFFVNNISGYVEAAVVDALAEAKEEVVGTVARGGQARRGLEQVVQLGDEEATKQLLLSSDVIIFSAQAQLREAREALKALRRGYEGEKTFVLVSTLLTWGQSPFTDEAPLHERDYLHRRPAPGFVDFKTLEAQVLSMASEQLRTYVVAAGLLYGQGEQLLRSFFKSAWLCDPVLRIPNLNGRRGSNVLPTMHVRDLASVVLQVAETQPESRYVAALDRSRPTLRQLVQSVARTLGWGKVEDMTEEETEAFVLADPAAAAVLGSVLRFDTAESTVEGLEFEWVAQRGLPAVAKRLAREYVDAFRLHPLRIVLLGPPAAGKSHFAALLARKYHLPVVTVGDAIRDALADEESKLAQDARESMAAAKDKRISPAVIGRIVRRQLLRPPCQNQGFVLDGCPRSYQEALAVFSKAAARADAADRAAAEGEGATEGGEEDAADEGDAAAAEEEEEEEEEGGVPRADPAVAPTAVVLLDAADDALKRRLLAMPPELVEGTHNTEAGFKRRLPRYRADNKPSKSGTPASFLEAACQLESLPVDVGGEANEAELLDCISLYVERRGRPNNFHPTPAELAAERAARERERAAREAAVVAAAEQERSTEGAQREAAEAEQARRLQELQREEEALLEVRSLPLRNYLMANVVPTLTEGLLAVCRANPEDPVDYLAEWLFKNNPFEDGEVESDSEP